MNLIFYGPSGTGKTYRLARLMPEYTGRLATLSRECWLEQQMIDARWFDVVVAALSDLGGEAEVARIAAHEFIRAKARSQGRTNAESTVWTTLRQHLRALPETVTSSVRYEPLVFDRRGGSVWWLIEDWREHCAEQIERARLWKAASAPAGRHDRYAFVTFHPAYSYEDFVEGLRPASDDDPGTGRYPVRPGILRRICKRARADPANRYALFIDEINRGDVARIFGELITLIETDKRARYDRDGQLIGGMEVTLPYSGEPLGVPANLDIYATMGTEDRAHALTDTTLRRRFRFEELVPQPAAIMGASNDGYIEDGDGGRINLRALLAAINRRLTSLLGRDMTLGHAYFMQVRSFQDLRQVLLDQIVPLLQEYFRGDWHRIQFVLRDVDEAGQKLEPQVISHAPPVATDVPHGGHRDSTDPVEYCISAPEEITPDAIRKVYEYSFGAPRSDG